MERRLYKIRKKGKIFFLDIDNLDILNFQNSDKRKLYNEYEPKLWNDEDCIENELNIRHLRRITVCVSNDCNLRCKYCYAQGGNYGNSRNLMSKERANDFIEFCCHNYDKIDNILFFGGEPLMNPKIISLICNGFKKKAAKGLFPLPIFTMITNGTILSPFIISIIKDNISHITISIDGPKNINDRNRVYPNGHGSFDDIQHFIKECKKIPGLKIQYEATYTKSHLELGITKLSIQNFLEKTFNIKGIIINEDRLESSFILSEFQSITPQKLISTNFECLPLDFWQIVETVVCKKEHSFCGLLKDRITISSTGDIISCQMLMGNDSNVVSNINDPFFINKVVQNRHNFKNNSNCKRCWAFKICGGCPIPKFYINKKYHAIPSKEICSLTKEIIKESLGLLYLIYSEKELKEMFLLIVRKKFL